MMNLRYINLWLDSKTGYDNDYRHEFLLHTRFINHYLSIQIRKCKFATDGTFNMVSISPMPNNNVYWKINGMETLSITIPFDKVKYEKIRGTTDYEYYLELLENGFEIASKSKKIPLDTLMSLINDFRECGYKNEWQYKKKRFKEFDIEVILDCKFTSFDFQLVLTVNRILTKEHLSTGTILRTLPNEIYFDKVFKDILVDNKYITITDSSDSPRILINYADILNKNLSFNLVGEDYEFNKLLSYDGSGFNRPYATKIA